MTWDVIHTIGRIALTLVVVYKLTRYRDTMIMGERLGLGMMGGGGFLTIDVIWSGASSPFDGWAGTVLTYGAVLFLLSRMYRDHRHERRNKQQIDYARAHLAGRGRL